MWDLIVSVPDHCLSFYFLYSRHTKDGGQKHQTIFILLSYEGWGSETSKYFYTPVIRRMGGQKHQNIFYASVIRRMGVRSIKIFLYAPSS